MKAFNVRTTKYLFPFVVVLLATCGPLFAQVKLTEESWKMPTYEVLAPEKAPIFHSGGSYQGAKKVIYPYAMNDVISQERNERSWKFLILENEYIKLGITPEIGGKLYFATDKSNDYNFVYKNNEVKPSNIGMTGAWVSGGIEWCVLHHHRASTFLPMDYSVAENEDGSKTVFIGETEPRHRMRWNVGVTVRPGKSYFEAEVSIYNPTPFTHTFLYWANVAAHASNDYQTIFPPSVQIATFHSKNDFTHWPISTEMYRNQNFKAGVDVSWWKNVKKSASFFAWDLREDFMGGYDHGKHAGTVHIGDHNIVKGAKLWEWGSGPRGQATEGKLTETSGPYVEIMVGAFSDNQPDYTWIRPYEVKRFKQYWYPVRDIQGFKNANLEAAVNLERRDNGQVFLGYQTTSKVDRGRVILKNGNKVIFTEDLSLSPTRAFTQIVKTNKDTATTDLYTELRDLQTGKVLISYQPVQRERPDTLPKVVKPPARPEKIPTIEELYITGSRMEQFYKPSMPYYQEALQRDPGDIRTNIAVGNQHLKNGDYETARKHFATAIKRLTTDYTRPSTCEAHYLQGVTLKAMGLYDEAMDTLYRATWDYAWHSAAYFELAQISCIQGDFVRALHQVNESLSTNRRNHRAISLKASILRKQGQANDAIPILNTMLEQDPLNFRGMNELYLSYKASGNAQAARKLLADLNEKMRGFDQNYLEVAVGYLNEGMLAEADNMLSRFEGENPIVHYYLGFIADKKGDKAQAKRQFALGQSLPEEGCFPFRLETVNVLKKAIEYDNRDGKAYYYLGNILYQKQPEVAITHWESATKRDPQLAMAFRNLGWGYYRHHKDIPKAIAHYERALALENNEAILYEELDRLYELNNSPIEARLKIFEGHNDVVKRRDDAFIRQIGVLTLAGEADKSVEYLKDKVFSYREGSSRVRETIIDAHLSLGMKYLDEQKNQEALEQFLMARVPDEEAGSARFGNRNIQVHYFIARAYEALGEAQKATEHDQLASEGDHTQRTAIMSYYQGLSWQKRNDQKRAQKIFEELVAKGEQELNSGEERQDRFFSIFGEREAESIRKSMAYTLRGLGYKGLGDKAKARADLARAVELSQGNLWARTEMAQMNE